MLLQAPVSVRALVQRINRRQAREQQAIKACRSSRWESSLGHYYRWCKSRQRILETHVNLETLGRQLAVLGDVE